jgi:hypothetical protein
MLTEERSDQLYAPITPPIKFPKLLETRDLDHFFKKEPRYDIGDDSSIFHTVSQVVQMYMYFIPSSS